VFAVAAFVCVPIAVGAEPKEKDEVDKARLVGVWEIDFPKGTTWEFTADGKLTMTIKGDKETVSIEGTYTITGNTIKAESPQAKISLTVEKLTEKELITINEKNKKEVFVKVK